MVYRVYSNIQGWNLLGVESDMKKVIEIINANIYTHDEINYMVIAHYKELDTDVPCKIIDSEEDFLELVDEYRKSQEQDCQRRTLKI